MLEQPWWRKLSGEQRRQNLSSRRSSIYQIMFPTNPLIYVLAALSGRFLERAILPKESGVTFVQSQTML